MRKFLSALSGIPLLLVLFVCASPAHAQATRTWVSGVGDDVNPCSRTAPCKTFAGAISKTAAGGEINCIDPGGFGAVTITKTIIIDCKNTEAGVLAGGGSNGIVVSAGANDVVTLRGLDITGTTATPARFGILFNSGAALHVEQCRIREFQQQTPFPSGFGILFQPSASSELYVVDSYITNNGAGSAGGAVNIRTTGAGSARAVISNTKALNNITGFSVDTGTLPSSGNSVMIVQNSVSAGNSFTGTSAVSAAAGHATIIIDGTLISNNGTGVSASGVNSSVIVGRSTIMENTTGLSGTISTFGNNQVGFNTTNGSFVAPPVPLE